MYKILFVEDYYPGVKKSYSDSDMTKFAGYVKFENKLTHSGYEPHLVWWEGEGLTGVMASLGNPKELGASA